MFILFIALSLSSCGISHIVNRGEYIDQQSIHIGTHRTDVLARFGSPIDRKMEGKTVSEIYRAPQGETGSGKAIKGGALLALDILTLGLAEIVASPVTYGTQYVTFRVTFDQDDLVTEYIILGK